MACWVYEGVLLFGVVFISAYLFSTLTQTRHALHNRHLLQAFLFLVFGVYFTWFWSHGQTLAMKTWRIRVLDQHGQPLTQARAFRRYALSWLWFLPPLTLATPLGLGPIQSVSMMSAWVLIWAGLSRLHPSQQFWHDAWAGTRLVQE
jgi:uncharacterized RDD family membrane protein YckC